MPIISRQCIERIKGSVDIYDVVSRTVELKKAGRKWKGLSPFSNEKTPSFYVNPDINVFYCFSTQTGGDVVKYVMLTERLNFQEAAEALAERYNIPLEYDQGGPNREQRSLAKQVTEVHEQACAFFHRLFLSDKDPGKVARAYWLEKRGFSLELAKEFKIGVAPPDGAGFAAFLLKKGFDKEALAESGLFHKNQRHPDPTYWATRFAGRLTVPIRDLRGRIVAFTARKLEITPKTDVAYDAKYVNSPDTTIFKKSRVVFNLDRAKEHIRNDATRTFTVVEGQLDALRCWDTGLRTVVALQGTAVDQGQIDLLARDGHRIDVVLDGDAAGRRAAAKLFPFALKAGLDIRFLVLPDGEDPDTFLAAGGPTAFDPIREQAGSPIAFILEALLPEGGLDGASAQMRASALQKAFELIAESPSEVVRQDIARQAAEALRLDHGPVLTDFRRYLRTRYQREAQRGRGFERQPQAGGGQTPAPENASKRLTTAEHDLLLMVFHYNDLGPVVAQSLESDWIDRSSIHGTLLARILANISEGLWEGTEDLDDIAETEEERREAYALLMMELQQDKPAEIAESCINTIRQRFVSREEASVRDQIAKLPSPSPEFPNLQKRLIDLRKIRQHRIRLEPVPQPAPATR